MDNNLSQFQNGIVSRSKRKWSKRPFLLIFLLLILVTGYFSFRLGSIYNTIVIENQSFWSNVSEALFGSQIVVYTVDANPIPEPETDRLDVLVLGLRGYDEKAISDEGGLLTDTILLISLDKKKEQVAMLSIPRDLYIDMLNVKGKINEAYERGLQKNNGLGLAKQIVSKITGVYVDKAVVVNFNAFKHIIDTLGGIEINLSRPFEESREWGFLFQLPAGKNHLTGEQALYYVRSRFSTSDFDRARRQQEVIEIIKNKLVSNGYLTNPTKITSFLSALKDDIRTDFQIWDINDVLELAKSFGSKNRITNYVLHSDNLLYESKTPKGEYILLPKGDNYNGIKALFVNIFSEVLK